jgi:hypothetical protein
VFWTCGYLVRPRSVGILKLILYIKNYWRNFFILSAAERDCVHCRCPLGWQERKYFVINARFRIGADPHHFAGPGSVDIVFKQMKK